MVAGGFTLLHLDHLQSLDNTAVKSTHKIASSCEVIMGEMNAAFSDY